MNIFALAQLINSIVFLAVALIIFKNNHKSPTYKNIIGILASLSLWCFFYFLWQLSTDEFIAELWFRITMFWAILISFFFARFAIHFLNQAEKHKIFFYVTDLITPLFLIGSLLGYLSSGSRTNFAGLNLTPIAGVLFLPMIIYFGIQMFYGLIILLLSYKTSNAVVKQQIKYIIFGASLAYISNLSNYAAFFKIDLPPYGILFISIFVIFFIYSLISRRLVDLKIALHRPTIYIVIFFILLIEIVVAKFLLLIFIPKFSFWLDIVANILIALAYPKTKKFVYKFAHKYFFTSYYEPSKIIEIVSEKLGGTLNISAIYKILDKTIINTFHTEAISILLFDPKNNNFFAAYSNGFVKKNKRSFTLTKEIFKKVALSKAPIIVEDLKKMLRNQPNSQELITDLVDYGVSIIAPMNLKNKNVGLIVLGKKISGDTYYDIDLKVLKTIGQEAALSIENARLYNEVADFSNTLQHKVDLQTHELIERAEHLKKLMEMRSEFLDIASHQLRTPVSVIKGVLSMIEEGSIPKDKEKLFISGALEKSIKLGEIINDILRASEMDSEKFELHNKPTNLDDVIKKINNDKLRNAQVKKITFSIILPTVPLPLVTVDERYIEHAIINLINNAIQYTPKGSVTVTFETTSANVIIRVIDTGIGIPTPNIPKLFQKFSRADNAVEAYADGSGLGLFIVKQIIDATPGATVGVEKSEMDKGTTFIMTLPIAK